MSGQPLVISSSGLVVSIGPDPAELSEEVKKLNDLFQDPHPGLITWSEALRNQAEKSLHTPRKIWLCTEKLALSLRSRVYLNG